MVIFGVNKGTTTSGKRLKDGGITVVRDGRVILSVAEERLSRKKHGGGFSLSLNTAFNELHLQEEDIDVVAVSTCCEPEENAGIGHELASHSGLITVNHHLSHACQAYHQSGFDRALIVVIDGGGNTFATSDSQEWWHVPREQHCYYIGDHGSISLVDRDFFEPYEVGFGELYRAFTYYLGFPSGSLASHTMALAAHGRRNQFKGHSCFEWIDGHLKTPLMNNPDEPVDMVRSLARTLSLDFGEPRARQEEILQVHRDIAAYIQMCVEETLLTKLRWLKRNFQSENLCLAGGFFLNCVCNGRLASEGLFDHVYVPSAPGDTGQCLGNAIFAATSGKHRTSHILDFAWRTSQDAAQGPQYSVNFQELTTLLLQYGCGGSVLTTLLNPSRQTAQLVSEGSTVAIFRGRSEVGPRALGNRSILADPRDDYVVQHLNNAKNREWFMPFAPVTLEHNNCFELDIASPFMSFAITMNPADRSALPAVSNHDGTSRVQTISEKTFVGSVLEELADSTGHSVALNTSFNQGGEPIVETVDDAVKSFSKMPLNCLLVEDVLVMKRTNPQLVDMGLIPRKFDFPFLVGPKGASRLAGGTPSEVVDWLRRQTEQLIYLRQYFPLYRRYADLLIAGKKRTTTRYRYNSVEVPSSMSLPLFITRGFEKAAPSGHPVGWINITGISYKRFSQLDEGDAIKDGFGTLREMKAVFQAEIYPAIRESDWVTIYAIKMNDAETH